MEAAVNTKIFLYVCLFCLFQGYCFQIHGDKGTVYQALSNKNTINRIKRGVDWSKRIVASIPAEIPKYEPAQSENVEIVSKPSKVVRRLRVSHGTLKNNRTVEENTPQNRTTERANKIVRIKKFKRKPSRKFTTAIPKTTTPSLEDTSTETITTTRKSLFKKPRIPTTVIPKFTSSSPYSHITVINKEIRNPKRNKKNKKNNQKHQFIPTYSYDTAEKHNGFIDMTEKPEQLGYLEHQPRPLDGADFYSSYRGNYGKRDNLVQSIKPKEINREREKNMQIANDKVVNNNKAFDTNPGLSRSPFENQKQMYHPTYSRSVSVSQKRQSPSSMVLPYEREKNDFSVTAPSVKENLRESSSSLDEIQGTLGKNRTDSRLEDSSNNESGTKAAVDRAGDSVSSTTGALKDPTVSPLKKGVISSSPSPAPELRVLNHFDPNSGIITHTQNRIPQQFPSILYGEQNAFSDPFFDTPNIGMPFQRNRPHILPLMHPYSPFSASEKSQDDSYLFRDEIQPYKSDEFMIPSFYPGSGITSIRRSILDAYGDDTTTSEPVTHFSLPKFEIPSIDFNDKGCKTVYKEVKTVPGDNVQSRNSNAKSVVMARECFFPNGIPTIKRTNVEDVISEVPVTEDLKTENFKSDSKG